MTAINYGEGMKTISLETLRSSFYDEKIRETEVSDLAHDMQNELVRYFKARMKLEPRPLDVEGFESIYDPSLPTIVVDPDHTFSGSELLGLASREDDTRANIIYLPTASGSASIQRNPTSNEAYLEVSSGAVVLPSGQVAYGEFPYPIAADIFETADLALIEQCEKYGVASFHSSKSMRHFNDKALLESLSSNAYTYTPRRIDRDTFLDQEKTDNLVVKPSKHSQGRGVLLTDNDADVEHTKNFYRFLEDNNYEPVVEERARSWEITNPATGERLDWNVRAILSYGDLVDMYVRADKWGGPVNMSVSAGAISMKDFPYYFKDPNDAWKIMQVLHDSAQAVAEENPASLIGVDLTVDENMQACLFEINNGNTGGLQTIAKLEDTYDGKLDMTRKVLRKFMDHTPPKQPLGDWEGCESIPLEPSFDTISRKAYIGKLRDKLARLDINEIPDNDEERFGAVLALVAIRSEYYWQLFDRSVHKESGERLRNQYPLELRRHLSQVYMGSFHASSHKELLPYLSNYGELFRDDSETLGFQAKIAAERFDLKAYYKVYEQFEERFEDQAPSLNGFTIPEFEDRFKSLTKKLNDETKEKFHLLLRNVITAYCEYGYDTADKLINRALEQSGINNPLSRLTNSLQFCMAYGDERYDDAMRHFYTCEDDFENRWDFYDHIIDDLIPRGPSEFEECSLDGLLFATKINMMANGAVSTLADTMDYLRTDDVDGETRAAVVRIIAELTPLEHTNEEYQQFVNVLEKIAASRNVLTVNHSPLPNLMGKSDYAKYTLLIERTFAGDRDNALQLIELLEDVGEISGGLDYLQDVYFSP